MAQYEVLSRLFPGERERGKRENISQDSQWSQVGFKPGTEALSLELTGSVGYA
jgi:hypothetical protein